MTLAEQAPGRRDLAAAGLRALWWTAAAIFVVAAHLGVAWIAVGWRSAAAVEGEPPPAVMIELAPIAVAPKAPPQEVAPGPQSAEAAPGSNDDAPAEKTRPEPPPRPESKPVEEPPTGPAATPVAAPVRPAQEEAPPLPAQASDVEAPALPPQDHAEAILPALSPAQSAPARVALAPERLKDEAAPPVAPVRPRPAKPPRTSRGREAHRASAPPATAARPAASAAAPTSNASVAPAVAPAAWKSALLALLNRNKRYPLAAAGFGTASVAFAIDRAGHVLSVRLTASSGDRALDEEAVALLRRSDPVPAPPPEFRRDVMTLTVPIHFDRSR